ncbi:MAG TPA: thiamine pyrophosphate-binding protein [Thermomicrobiaceae bacterium]|nr:thiamine pyrophosphate-binding protein [Thermomicrobiaceae bacterium]
MAGTAKWEDDLAPLLNPEPPAPARQGGSSLGIDGVAPAEWAGLIVGALRRHEVGLVSYVPDGALAPLIERFQADVAVTCFTSTREDEAIAIAAGAALGGLRSVAMMQSSGFGNVSNALASLTTPYQIPMVLIVTERGILGEFNPVQTPITRVIRPTLDALGIPHATVERLDEVQFLADRIASQAYRTNQVGVLILSPKLTGGKTEPGSASARSTRTAA